MCHEMIFVSHPIGKFSFCLDCLTRIHKDIFSRIPQQKLKFISYLEQEILIDVYFICRTINAEIIFQYEIHGFAFGCALEKAAEKGGYDFNCPEGYENYSDCIDDDYCHFGYSYKYNKYVLDFAIFKGEKKIDLEVDGVSFHDTVYDAVRDEFMKNKGWVILRYKYKDVLKNKQKILDDIEKELN